MFSVIRTYKIWFAISGALIVASLVLLFTWGLQPSIEFRGGSLLEIQFEKPVNPVELRGHLASSGFSDAVVQSSSETILFIKTRPLEGETLANFKRTISDRFGNFQELRFDSIGPAVGKELVNRGYLQIVLVVLGIVLYIAYSFRNIQNNAEHNQHNLQKRSVYQFF